MAAPTEHDENLLSKMKQCVFHFSNDFPAFREAELEGVSEATGIKLNLHDNHTHDCPFKKYINLTQQDIGALAHRTVSLRGIYEYFCESDTFEDLLDKIAGYKQTDDEKKKSYKINIEPCNRTYTNRTDVKLSRIDKVATALDMVGAVNLRKPDVIYTVFEYYPPDHSQPASEPEKLYFGKLILESKREADIRKFSIKTRKFIGNTSMDPTLSLLMANIAGVKASSVVLDPFVGTGSLLLACAHYGGYTVGTDINRILLHGRGRSSRAKKTWRERDECVRANFEQYELGSKYLDILVADASKHNMWAIDGMFDAIVTDPPYGIREQTLKLEAPVADVKKPNYLPPTSRYDLSDVFTDLTTLGSRCLNLGGRLVFWLPIYRPDYHEDNIPKHPCFKVVSNCEQILSAMISRRLITMQKILEPSQVSESELKVEVTKDHYSESFRDRYFQVSDPSTPDGETSNQPHK